MDPSPMDTSTDEPTSFYRPLMVESQNPENMVRSFGRDECRASAELYYDKEANKTDASAAILDGEAIRLNMQKRCEKLTRLERRSRILANYLPELRKLKKLRKKNDNGLRYLQLRDRKIVGLIHTLDKDLSTVEDLKALFEAINKVISLWNRLTKVHESQGQILQNRYVSLVYGRYFHGTSGRFATHQTTEDYLIDSVFDIAKMNDCDSPTKLKAKQLLFLTDRCDLSGAWPGLQDECMKNEYTCYQLIARLSPHASDDEALLHQAYGRPTYSVAASNLRSHLVCLMNIIIKRLDYFEMKCVSLRECLLKEPLLVSVGEIVKMAEPTTPEERSFIDRIDNFFSRLQKQKLIIKGGYIYRRMIGGT